MRIYLMRHAEAVEPADWSGPDKSRPLTPAGLAKLNAAVEGMRRVKLSADSVLTSPFVRAVQTAQVVSEALHALQTVPCPELASGARLEAFTSVVRRHLSDPAVIIVCHMPEICVFASRLTQDPQALEQPFKAGEILAAECEVANGELAGGRLLWRRTLDQWAAAAGV